MSQQVLLVIICVLIVVSSISLMLVRRSNRKLIEKMNYHQKRISELNKK